MKRPMRVRELAELLRARLEGDGGLLIEGAAPLESAEGSDLSFATGKALSDVASSGAGCLIVPENFANITNRTLIRAEKPRAAFALALAHLYPPEPINSSVHPSAVIAHDAVLADTCEIGPHVVVGSRSRVGANTRVGANSVIGSDVRLGEGCRLAPGVAIYNGVTVGDRVTLHSGCVLGADGFGFVLIDGRYEKFPQVGSVVIEDDVEIGANSCVDRAALGATVIGAGTKLDNMVHVGHNCRIGKHVVIAAQTGLSGGVTIEDNAVIGGQVGIGDKARIEANAVLGSGSGVLTSKVVRAGEPVWGTPARPLRRHLEQLANLSKLPELRSEVTELKRRLQRLEEKG